MSRDEINAIGTLLAKLRHADERAVAVSFACHEPSHETRNGSISATVTAGGITATAEAIDLDCALSLARGKVRREAEAKAKKAAEDAKATKPSERTQ